jgi:hypothetical protein
MQRCRFFSRHFSHLNFVHLRSTVSGACMCMHTRTCANSPCNGPSFSSTAVSCGVPPGPRFAPFSVSQTDPITVTVNALTPHAITLAVAERGSVNATAVSDAVTLDVNVEVSWASAIYAHAVLGQHVAPVARISPPQSPVRTADRAPSPSNSTEATANKMQVARVSTPAASLALLPPKPLSRTRSPSPMSGPSARSLQVPSPTPAGRDPTRRQYDISTVISLHWHVDTSENVNRTRASRTDEPFLSNRFDVLMNGTFLRVFSPMFRAACFLFRSFLGRSTPFLSA